MVCSLDVYLIIIFKLLGLGLMHFSVCMLYFTIKVVGKKENDDVYCSILSFSMC